MAPRVSASFPVDLDTSSIYSFRYCQKSFRYLFVSYLIPTPASISPDLYHNDFFLPPTRDHTRSLHHLRQGRKEAVRTLPAGAIWIPAAADPPPPPPHLQFNKRSFSGSTTMKSARSDTPLGVYLRARVEAHLFQRSGRIHPLFKLGIPDRFRRDSTNSFYASSSSRRLRRHPRPPKPTFVDHVRTDKLPEVQVLPL